PTPSFAQGLENVCGIIPPHGGPLPRTDRRRRLAPDEPGGSDSVPAHPDLWRHRRARRNLRAGRLLAPRWRHYLGWRGARRRLRSVPRGTLRLLALCSAAEAAPNQYSPAVHDRGGGEGVGDSHGDGPRTVRVAVGRLFQEEDRQGYRAALSVDPSRQHLPTGALRDGDRLGGLRRPRLPKRSRSRSDEPRRQARDAQSTPDLDGDLYRLDPGVELLPLIWTPRKGTR